MPTAALLNYFADIKGPRVNHTRRQKLIDILAMQLFRSGGDELSLGHVR